MCKMYLRTYNLTTLRTYPLSKYLIRYIIFNRYNIFGIHCEKTTDELRLKNDNFNKLKTLSSKIIIENYLKR